MKNLLLLFSLVFLLSSCGKRGDVKTAASDFIKIHGKVYKLVKVVPDDGDHAIWIMYPKDSLDSQPTVINQTVTEGKYTRNQAVIQID